MLVIIPCGSKKLKTAAKAKDIYTGGYFKACLNFAKSIAPEADIRILSGKHGLLPLDKVIEPYEMRLGQRGSIQFADIKNQAVAQNLLNESNVIVAAGKDYAGIALALWPHANWVLRGAGGMGKQIQKLKIMTKE